jgi:hypothetical protein
MELSGDFAIKYPFKLHSFSNYIEIGMKHGSGGSNKGPKIG